MRKVKLREPVECFWEPPGVDELMLCCDGAARGNPGVVGEGVVARDTDSNVLGVMCIGLGITTNYLVEVFVVIVGLQCATKFGMTQVCIRTDSMAVVHTFAASIYDVTWFITLGGC